MRNDHNVTKGVKLKITEADVESAIKHKNEYLSSQSKTFAAMGSAILNKIRRHNKLDNIVANKHYFKIHTKKEDINISVIVSSIRGVISNKHLIIPKSDIDNTQNKHIVVCAFVSKRESAKNTSKGFNTIIAGWGFADEMKNKSTPCRVNTILNVYTVPVNKLRPFQTLKPYLMGLSNPKTTTSKDKDKEDSK